MKPHLFLMILLMQIFCSCKNNNMKFYVSPSGKDSNPGTKGQPFLSFNKAKEAVSQIIANGTENQEIDVYFRGGTYFFEGSAVIKSNEFSKGNNKVIFSAYQDEKPVFSAGKKLTGWAILTDSLPFLSEKARGKVWVTDIPVNKQASIARFLCDGSCPLTNAVSEALYTEENDSISKLEDDFRISAEQLSFFVFPKRSFRQWENLQDIEIITIPHEAWTINILPLKSIDMDNKIAYTTIPATYRICRDSYYKIPNLWVQNAIDYLDEPGEWVINSSKGKVYYWPKGETPANVYYPMLQEIIRVEGDEKKGEIVKNIEFRGIAFTHAGRDTWSKDAIGLQHNWALYNESDALLRFVDAEKCVVNNCTFINSGGGGVRFDFYSQNNQVVNCGFSQLGGTSILLAGYGPGKKNVNKNNSIMNNEIHDCGQIYTHSHGIFIWQSGGNWIAHNLIYNMPYDGIVISGPRPEFFNTRMGNRREQTGTINFNEIENFDVNSEDWDQFHPYVDVWDQMFKYLFASDNIVEYNELHHNDLKLNDGNAIYLSGTGRNNIIRRNYAHDNISSCLHGIIRADDQAKDVTITENIIYKFTGTGIKIKHPCVVTNNFVIDWIPSEWPNREKTSMCEFLNVSPAGPIKGSIIKNNICYQSRGETERFFLLDIYYPLGKKTKLVDIDMDNNLYFASGVYNDCIQQLNELKKQGVDQNSIIADPLFEGFDEAQFKLKENSPAYQLQIKQIDFENIGLLKK
jgi:hypothetical protein